MALELFSQINHRQNRNFANRTHALTIRFPINSRPALSDKGNSVAW